MMKLVELREHLRKKRDPEQEPKTVRSLPAFSTGVAALTFNAREARHLNSNAETREALRLRKVLREKGWPKGSVARCEIDVDKLSETRTVVFIVKHSIDVYVLAARWVGSGKIEVLVPCYKDFNSYYQWYESEGGHFFKLEVSRATSLDWKLL